MRVLMVALALWAGQAGAAVIDISPIVGGPVVDFPVATDGYVFDPQGRDLGSFNVPDAIHMDDSGAGFARTLSLSRQDGGTFSFLSFLHFSEHSAFMVFNGTDWISTEYASLIVEVYNGTTLMDRLAYMTGTGTSTHRLPETFRAITSVVFRAVVPDNLVERSRECFNFPCGHFSLAEFDVAATAPIPLPATASLLLAGMGAMLFVGKSARRRGAARRAR
jgi:hypothetical protein